MSLTRKEHSLKLSIKKYHELTDVIRSFVSAQNFFLRNFAGIQGLSYSSYPRGLRDQYVREGLPRELARLGLQDRQWKMALDVAFDTIKSSHAKTQEDVKISLNHSLLNDSEKHLIRYVLQRPNLLQFICLRKYKEAIGLLEIQSQASGFNPNLKEALYCSHKSFQPKKVQRAFRWLSRRYRTIHSRHQRPVIRKMRTYHVDCNMFSFFKENRRCYIAVASKVPRQRIVIPLTHPTLTSTDFAGNLKVILRKDGKVEIHRTLNQVVKKCLMTREDAIYKKQDLKITAIDKGMKALIHTDEEKTYGTGYLEKSQEWSDELSQINSGRARFHSLVRTLEADLLKATHPQHQARIQKQIDQIRKNNLGSIKVSSKREFVQQEIKKEIGTAVNALFKDPMDVLVVENLKFISFKNLGRRTNRLINTWSKGILRAALEKGATKNGVLLEEINAAFTSQQCRHCFYVDRKNRKGDLFACVVCQHKENADFAAAKNVKSRFFDSEIGAKTPVKEIKEILMQRHRVSLSTLGLNKSVSRLSSANGQESLYDVGTHFTTF